MVSRHRRDDETFLFCIDSNARVGSVISNSVGGAEPDEESKNGEFFHAFLARTVMALPATFRGGGGTLQDRTGRWHRLDHVGVACGELRQFRAWRSIRVACWRSKSAKITSGYCFDAMVLSEAGGTFPHSRLWCKLCRSSETAAVSGP